jgi:hypothetical protein
MSVGVYLGRSLLPALERVLVLEADDFDQK